VNWVCRAPERRIVCQKGCRGRRGEKKPGIPEHQIDGEARPPEDDPQGIPPVRPRGPPGRPEGDDDHGRDEKPVECRNRSLHVGDLYKYRRTPDAKNPYRNRRVSGKLGEMTTIEISDQSRAVKARPFKTSLSDQVDVFALFKGFLDDPVQAMIGPSKRRQTSKV
jgi:hypothetical protein